MLRLAGIRRLHHTMIEMFITSEGAQVGQSLACCHFLLMLVMAGPSAAAGSHLRPFQLRVGLAPGRARLGPDVNTLAMHRRHAL